VVVKDYYCLPSKIKMKILEMGMPLEACMNMTHPLIASTENNLEFIDGIG